MFTISQHIFLSTTIERLSDRLLQDIATEEWFCKLLIKDNSDAHQQEIAPVVGGALESSMLVVLILICLCLLSRLYLMLRKQRESDILVSQPREREAECKPLSPTAADMVMEEAPQHAKSCPELLDSWQTIITHWGVPNMVTEYDAETAWQAWCKKWKWKFKVGKKVTVKPKGIMWKESLGIPFPDVHIAEELPQMTHAAEESEYAASLRRVAQRRVEIAAEFVAWAKRQSAEKGLLLVPEEDEIFWFIGDMHGCLSALIRILVFIERQRKPQKKYTLIFLGDLLDRGKDSWGVAAIVQHLILHTPESCRVIFIKGNHDAGFYIKENGSPASAVSPAEALEELHQMTNQKDAALLAEAFCELQRISPCMAEILCPGDDAPPNATLLLCHGGLPHTDLQEIIFKNFLCARDFQLSAPQWRDCDFMRALGQCRIDDLLRQVEKDFEWVRLSSKSAHIHIESDTKKSGCTMGFNDVNMYRRLHYLLTGRAITFILRGHSHEDKGYAVYHHHPLYNPVTNANQVQTSCGILTITSFEMEDQPLNKRRSAVACWAASSSCIEVFPLPKISQPN